MDIYDADQIRELHTNFPPKFFGSNSPKAALAHIKLCLYDNEFKRTAKYPHYYMPRNHIWSELKKYVYTNPNGYFESGRGVSDGGDLTFGYYDYNPPTLTSITTPQPPETDASQNNKNNVEYSNKTNGTGRTS